VKATLPKYLQAGKSADTALQSIAAKVHASERITTDDALLLYERASLSFAGSLANLIRERKHGDRTYFNRNFHIEPTNVCVYDCKFCSYSRKIRKREDGWELSMDEMFDIVKKYDGLPVTEVHIVGGVLPQYDLEFYVELFRRIKAHRPELHIKALTPVEYHYIFKKAKVSYATGMQLMKDAGVDSLPGGGAEIFHPEVREQISADKCTGDEWLEIHKIWHQLGMRSNATMLYGHLENFAHRVHHLECLRSLQDKTGGFQTFIPLKFRNQDNQMSHLPESHALEDLRNYAISRIFLDNFDHIKAYWPMIGRSTAQLSLAFGVNDVDGTIDDTTRIYSMAGAEEQNPSLTTEQLVNMIRRVNRHPIERDTLYNVIRDYKDVVFEEDNQYQGYTPLPVINGPN
jgi:aminodeoxyfutalosine synthase